LSQAHPHSVHELAGGGKSASCFLPLLINFQLLLMSTPRPSKKRKTSEQPQLALPPSSLPPANPPPLPIASTTIDASPSLPPQQTPAETGEPVDEEQEPKEPTEEELEERRRVFEAVAEDYHDSPSLSPPPSTLSRALTIFTFTQSLPNYRSSTPERSHSSGSSRTLNKVRFPSSLFPLSHR
jgi:hypothetical protein